MKESAVQVEPEHVVIDFDVNNLGKYGCAILNRFETGGSWLFISRCKHESTRRPIYKLATTSRSMFIYMQTLCTGCQLIILTTLLDTLVPGGLSHSTTNTGLTAIPRIVPS